MGLMNVQAARQEENNQPVQNYTVAAIQRQVFSRSNIGLFVINKQSIGNIAHIDSSKPMFTRFNRNVGIEYNLASSNNLWTGKMLLIRSFTEGSQINEMVKTGHLQYSSRKWTIALQVEDVGNGFTAETGYVPRRNYIKLYPQLTRNFFPKSGRVLMHGPKFFQTIFSRRMRETDYEHVFIYNVVFRDQSVFAPWYSKNYVQLLQPFDPTNMLKDSLPALSRHYWDAYGADFISKPQSVFTYNFSTRYGGYYSSGKRFNLIGEIGYRLQPYLNISVSANFNMISLPQPWGNVNFILVGPRIDLTMSNKLFLTGFLQFNEQTDNVNLNLRFQWRYKPASDLYIVFTDNYLPENFSVRNRALVVKFNYWWNR